MPKRTQKVAGNTGRMAQAEAIDLATKMLRDELEKVKSQLAGSQMEAAALRTERDQGRESQAGLLRDARSALRYCASLAEFRAGGPYHKGFLGTVAPTLSRLEREVVPTTVPEPQDQPAPTDPVPSP